MKRFLALFLTIIMLLAMFASCKPNEVPEETTPESTTPEATTPDQGGTIMPPMENLAEHILPPLNPTQLFDASFGCKEAIFQDVASIDKILAAFTSQGYTQIAADMVEGAKFQTILLNKADELVTVYWIASEKEARVVAEKVTPEALSVLQKNSTTDTGLVTMVQS